MTSGTKEWHAHPQAVTSIFTILQAVSSDYYHRVEMLQSGTLTNRFSYCLVLTEQKASGLALDTLNDQRRLIYPIMAAVSNLEIQE